MEQLLMKRKGHNTTQYILQQSTMKQATICLILVLAASLQGHLALKYSSRQVCDPSPSNQTIYDFSLDDVYQNDTIDFSAYRGKLVLLVNTATYCGHVGQYIGLNALQEEHGDEGLQVIGVPCNQFAMVRLWCSVINPFKKLVYSQAFLVSKNITFRISLSLDTSC